MTIRVVSTVAVVVVALILAGRLTLTATREAAGQLPATEPSRRFAALHPDSARETEQRAPASDDRAVGESTGAQQAHAVPTDQSIDWEAFPAQHPIPSRIPATPSDDAVEAGFPREWLEINLRHFGASTGVYKGKSAQIDALPLARSIVSEKKDTADSWAHGLEYDIRRFIAEYGEEGAARSSRVFCNAYGCLCYLEYGIRTPLTRHLVHALRESTWARVYDIQPYAVYVAGAGTWPDGKSVWWDLILIDRTR